MNRILLITFLAFLSIKGLAQGVTTDTSNYLASGNWDNYLLWSLSKNSGVSAAKSNFNGLNNDGLAIAYTFPVQGNWLDLSIALPDNFVRKNPIAFFVKSSTSANNLELKFMDNDGSIFWRVVPLSGYTEWEHVVIYLGDTEYAWGGNATFDEFSKFSVAVNGIGSGTIWIDEIGIGLDTLPSTFPSTYDPDSTLSGIGFAQRRDSSMIKEDPLVLNYLKVIQDISSSGQDLLPAQEDDQVQTFNNSLVAISFIIKDERERAERILDFYANATNVNNTDIQLQNFYYNDQARGFYQWVSLATKRAPALTEDRWMGDMAWLLIACKNYEWKFNSDRYSNLVNIIKDLLISYYKEAPVGGYVQSGWRKGDSDLHEANGHPEGNIDCYVALKLCNENYYAQKIKEWLVNELNDRTNLPLDLYTWRTLAFGNDFANLLNIPEYDFRYRKIIEVGGNDVMGFYSMADIAIDNFWNDGTGHIACAYLAFGDTTRGFFYANQLDPLIISRVFDNDTTHTIPYTLNKTGGYDWVDPAKGFVSCAAWYIFAKNRYNPFLSEDFTDTVLSVPNKTLDQGFLNVSPNPFTVQTNIDFYVPGNDFVTIDLFDLYGRKVITLKEGTVSIGRYSVTWNGENTNHERVDSGVYLVRMVQKSNTDTRRVLFIE
ncbi:MAG: T9SS type A sorting domain-containing protein [Salinivirgaceae bacterium]